MLAAVAALATTATVAAEVAVPKFKSFLYDGVVDETGRVDVRLTNPPEAPAPKTLNVYAPDVRAVQSIIRSQDWYMEIGADGRPRGLYTVPSGNALSSNVVRGLTPGQSLLKVTPQSSFLKVFPSAAEMRREVATFAGNTQDAVCALSRRPERVRARLNVTPGWSAGGKIVLDATWRTQDLCRATDAEVARAAKAKAGALKVLPAAGKLKIAPPVAE